MEDGQHDCLKSSDLAGSPIGNLGVKDELRLDPGMGKKIGNRWCDPSGAVWLGNLVCSHKVEDGRLVRADHGKSDGNRRWHSVCLLLAIME